jgi:hypothetical protein
MLLTVACSSWSRPDATHLAAVPARTPVRGLTATGTRVEGRLLAVRGDTVLLQQHADTQAVAAGTAWQARRTDIGKTLLVAFLVPVALAVAFMLDNDGITN